MPSITRRATEGDHAKKTRKINRYVLHLHHPRKIETAIAFDNKKKAIAFEDYLKTGSGREFSKRHF